MKDNVCSKKFPKQALHFTTSSNDSFPLYRRRNRYHYVKRDAAGNVLYTLDDTWVVPYNPYLALKYDAHINVEICGTVAAVKYLYKYVYKGSDKASIRLESLSTNTSSNVNTNPVNDNIPVSIDEIKRYTDSRYIGPCEAVWHIYALQMSNHYPSIVHLQIHEENKHQVMYVEGQEVEALQNNSNPKTQLTQYFQKVLEEMSIAVTHAPSASDLTYSEFPKYYEAKSSSCIRLCN